MTGTPAKSGWICPNCGRQFARTNQGHICEKWTVEAHLAGKPETSLKLYQRCVGLVAACGDFEYSVTKSNIGFRGPRRVFAGAIPTPKGLQGYMDIPRLIDDPRFRSVSPYTKALFVHSFLITSEDQLNEEFAGWICESYAVGQGDHLRS